MTRPTTLPARLFCGALSLLLAACRTAPPPGPSAPAASGPQFEDIAAATGLNFHYFNGATGQFYFPEIMGAGVAIFDYDLDGDLDVYLIQGTLLDPARKLSEAVPPLPPGWNPGNRLFRNLLRETGQLRFEDVTAASGTGHVGYSLGAATGDFDGDGYPDLYVTAFGHNVLYRNNRNGTFSDVTARAGVDDPRWSTSASFCDYDGDGRLDLFVANYVDYTVAANHPCYFRTGELDYCGPRTYRGVTSSLFRNLGGGRFENVSRRAGIAAAAGAGLGVACADFNGDARPDFFVAVDGAANHLWLNRGDGAFHEQALAAGMAYDAQGQPHAGMGIAVGDIDNSGIEQVFVSNLTGEGGVLYSSSGPVYSETSMQRGLQQATFRGTGFGTGFFDADNDGWLDLFVANGAVRITESSRGKARPFDQQNQLLKNPGGNGRFRDISAQAGAAFGRPSVGRGTAFGDLDEDGRVDLIVTDNSGAVRLLRNVTPNPGHWLEIGLDSPTGNRLGIGARVGVMRAGEKPLWRRVFTDASYLSAGSHRVHFGLGAKPEVEKVVVVWPDGRREAWDRLPADRIHTLRAGSGRKE